MRPMIVMVLLLATGALGQGAYRPAPPVFVPSQDAPHTVGQPGHVRAAPELERSPHKRVLNEDERTRREPGVWAGDEPRAARGDVYAAIDLFVIPYPMDADGETRQEVNRCARSMNRSLLRTEMANRLTPLSKEIGRCTAAQLYLYCAGALLNAASKQHAMGTAMMDRLTRILLTAQAHEKEQCDAVRKNTEIREIVDIVANDWLRTFTKGQ